MSEENKKENIKETNSTDESSEKELAQFLINSGFKSLQSCLSLKNSTASTSDLTV